MTRADGPSGLMKVRSVSDLFEPCRCVAPEVMVPENPVTTASPSFKLSAGLGCCALAGLKRTTSSNSGKSRAMNFDKLPPLQLRAVASATRSDFRLFLAAANRRSNFEYCANELAVRSLSRQEKILRKCPALLLGKANATPALQLGEALIYAASVCGNTLALARVRPLSFIGKNLKAIAKNNREDLA